MPNCEEALEEIDEANKDNDEILEAIDGLEKQLKGHLEFGTMHVEELKKIAKGLDEIGGKQDRAAVSFRAVGDSCLKLGLGPTVQL